MGDDEEAAWEAPIRTGLLVLALAALGGPLALALVALLAGGVAAFAVGGRGAALTFELRFAGGAGMLGLVLIGAYLAGAALRSALRTPRPSGVLDVPIYVALALAIVVHGAAMFATVAGPPGHAPMVADAAVAAVLAALTAAGGAIGAYRRRARR